MLYNCISVHIIKHLIFVFDSLIRSILPSFQSMYLHRDITWHHTLQLSILNWILYQSINQPTNQPNTVFKGLAYPVNGIIMGGLDWKFTMLAMWLANGVCVGMIKFGGVMTLNKIWWALAAFMATQVVTGIIRFESKTGVWKMLKREGTMKWEESWGEEHYGLVWWAFGNSMIQFSNNI